MDRHHVVDTVMDECSETVEFVQKRLAHKLPDEYHDWTENADLEELAILDVELDARPHDREAWHDRRLLWMRWRRRRT